MYSVPVRANAVFCHWAIVVSVLVLGCKLTSTTYFAARGPISVHLRIDEVQFLMRHMAGYDEASIYFTLDADLRNVWTWNTQELYVGVVAAYNSTTVNDMIIWDRLITNKNQARLYVERQPCKYPIQDMGTGLRYAVYCIVS